jgi:hypothetical protein
VIIAAGTPAARRDGEEDQRSALIAGAVGLHVVTLAGAFRVAVLLLGAAAGLHA